MSTQSFNSGKIFIVGDNSQESIADRIAAHLADTAREVNYGIEFVGITHANLDNFVPDEGPGIIIILVNNDLLEHEENWSIKCLRQY